MNAVGHRAAVVELQGSKARLRPIDDIRADMEVCWGLALHLIAVGAQQTLGIHQDRHEGLVRWLRERGLTQVAERFAEIEALRIGHWFGRQGNGHTAARLDELLAQIEAWALA